MLAATRVDQLLEKERKGLWKTHRQQGIRLRRGPGIPSMTKTESDAEAIEEKKNISVKGEEEEEQYRQSVLLSRYTIQRGVCHLVSNRKTCEDLVSSLQENAGINDRTLSRATQKGSYSQDSQEQRGDNPLTKQAVILND